MNTQTLTVVEFHGHPLTLIEHDSQPYVAMRPIVEGIGLDWSGQLQRIKKHPVLSEGVGVMPTPSGGGGVQDTTFLALNLLNGWLFGIDTSRVKPELRETLIAYQRECFEVLHRHWHGEPSPQAPSVAYPRRGEADAVVDANRMFQAYLRSASAMKLPTYRAAPAANARVLTRTGIDLLDDLQISEEELMPQARAMEQAAVAALDPWADALDAWLIGRETVRTQEAADYLRGKRASKSDVLRVAVLIKSRGWKRRSVRGLSTPSGGGRVWMRPEQECAHA